MKKKLAAGLAGLVLVSTAGAHWKLSREIPAYEVARVIDGDTFETRERQQIRLAHIDAPDTGLCGSKHAKEALEKYILGQPVYIKVLWQDTFGRLVSVVYTPDIFVNAEMVRNGYAVYYPRSRSTTESGIVKRAGEQAREKGAGVNGLPCTQTENPEKPECRIKGNVRVGTNNRTYHLPGCNNYKNTEIELHLGDRWFCSEAEAIKAGFVKAGGCN
jgi:endonuclease YncB( thermonuclease family)